jgi:hypothetical protein
MCSVLAPLHPHDGAADPVTVTVRVAVWNPGALMLRL